MKKYDIALDVFMEYCETMHGSFESPSERLALGVWLMAKRKGMEK